MMEYAKLGIGVNAVCSGVIKITMVDRLTGKNKETEKQFKRWNPLEVCLLKSIINN